MSQPAAETQIARGPAVFPETCWTALLRAAGPADPRFQVATAHLVRAYWTPVHHFLRRRGRTMEDAKALTQDFFTVILERPFLQRADPRRGRFRTYVLASLDHFLKDDFDRRSAQKRGGGRPLISLDGDGFSAEEACLPPAAGSTPEEAFNRRWALSALASAEARLRRHCDRTQEGQVLQVFEALLLRRGENDGCTYAHVAQRLGVTESRVNTLLASARRLFRDALRDEVRLYSGPEANPEVEIDELLKALG